MRKLFVFDMVVGGWGDMVDFAGYEECVRIEYGLCFVNFIVTGKQIGRAHV